MLRPMIFTVNLASEPVVLLKRTRLGLIGLSVVLLMGGTALVGVGMALRQSLEMETARTAQLSSERQKVEALMRRQSIVLTDESRAALKAQVKVANQMIQQRLFSWSRLFLTLERAVPAGVSLVSVQPQPSTATLTLRGEALTLERLTGFVGKLQETAPFHDVFLEDQKGQPDGTVSFALHARY
ncbi:MAG TPA: PilN domain-containing protein [Nitrospiria bacterium]|nr:PilN domain-containing protein [Nitrospiria bacterium]